MKRIFLSIAVAALPLLASCAMFGAWRSIPPPGGCNQCHTLPISADWTVAYAPVQLTDERNRLPFQTEGSTVPQPASRPTSSLEVKKVEEARCFECHRAPNAAHKGRAGSYHHR